MAAQQNHDILILGLVGAAGFAAFALFKNMGGADGAGGSFFSPSPTPGNMVSAPINTPAPGGVQGSIVDARITPGGDVGYAMWLKNWTQIQAQTRLNALKDAFNNAKTQAAVTTSQGDTAGTNIWNGAAAAHDSDYFALTGQHLPR